MKKYLKKILVLTLILTLCTTTVLSGTLAKYVSSEEGTATVTAAQFLLTVTDDDTDSSDTIEFTVTNSGVDYGTSATLYPGASGWFDINVALIADVDADISGSAASSIVATDADGVITPTTELTATSTLLEATGLSFYVVAVLDGTTTYATVDAITAAEDSTGAVVVAAAGIDYSDLDEAIADAIDFEYNASVAEGTSAYTVYVAWVWDYESIEAITDDAEAIVEGSLSSEGTVETVDAGTLTYDSTAIPYYTFNGQNYSTTDAVIAAYNAVQDAADTKWGNAVATDIAANSSDSMTGVDIQFEVTVTATQSVDAMTDPDA